MLSGAENIVRAVFADIGAPLTGCRPFTGYENLGLFGPRKGVAQKAHQLGGIVPQEPVQKTAWPLSTLCSQLPGAQKHCQDRF